MKNTPYVKKYNSKKELLNPITKDNPYINEFKTTSYNKRMLKFKLDKNTNPDLKLYLKMKERFGVKTYSVEKGYKIKYMTYKKWLKRND